jgi:hypothetical protein
MSIARGGEFVFDDANKKRIPRALAEEFETLKPAASILKEAS